MRRAGLSATIADYFGHISTLVETTLPRTGRLVREPALVVMWKGLYDEGARCGSGHRILRGQPLGLLSGDVPAAFWTLAISS